MRRDTTAAGPRHMAAIWSDLCVRIAALLQIAEESASLQTRVSAVRDGQTLGQMIAHMSTVHQSFLADGRIGTVACCEPGVLQGHVDSGDTLAHLRGRWLRSVESVRATVGSAADDAVEQLICSDVMHEHDLRMALDQGGARDSDGIKVALDSFADGFSERVVTAGLPPLRVTVEQWGTIIGDGYAVECVVADRFEFVRAMAGRRAASEIGRWNWSADPARYVAVMSATGRPRTAELRERDPRVPRHMRDREFVL